MVRPTERFLVAILVMILTGGALVAFVLIDPLEVGEPGALTGKPHTKLSVIMTYVVFTFLFCAGCASLLRGIWRGGSLLSRRRWVTDIVAKTGVVELVAQVQLKGYEALDVVVTCKEDPGGPLKINCALLTLPSFPHGVAPAPPCTEASGEIAWGYNEQASFLLVPLGGPADYGLGVTTERKEEGEIPLSIKYAPTVTLRKWFWNRHRRATQVKCT